MAVRSKMSTARTRMGRAVTKTTSNDGKTSSSPKMLGEVGIKAKPKEGEPAKLDKGSKVQYQGVQEGLLKGSVKSDTFKVGEDTRSRKERTSTNPKADKWYDYRHPDADMTIADITDEDQELLRKQLRLEAMGSGDQDVELSQSMYDAWKKAGKKSEIDKFRSDFKTQEEFDKYNPYSQAADDWGFSGGLTAGLIPKDPERAKRSQRKELVKTGKAFAINAKKKRDKQFEKNIITKEKAAKEDINVPQVVEGPKGRTKTKSKLAFGYKPTIARKLNAPLKQKPVNWEDTDLIERMSGLQKPKTNWSRRGVTTVTTEKVKNARLSERMKYKKEEKLAGARERVLGMQGVALEDQINKSGRVTKRGENIEGSAQRLRDLKSLYSPDPSRPEKIKKMTDVRGSGERTAALKEAKADIKEIGKLSRGQAKGLRTEGSAKGRAITKAKSMMAEARSAAKPKKFSKDTGVSGLEEDLKAMKAAKSPAEIKAMKSSARTAMKEARGLKKTAEEKKMIRTGVKGTRGVAKEARSYKGDIRKGLRMEKRDVRGMNASDLASKAKKDKLAAKGKTLKGTGYFTMENLNKTIPLSQASNVSKYKEEKVKLTREEKKGMASKKPSTNVFMLASKAEKAKRGARTYNESQGVKQAGTRRFVKK